jgi:hypothetical protein
MAMTHELGIIREILDLKYQESAWKASRKMALDFLEFSLG